MGDCGCGGGARKAAEPFCAQIEREGAALLIRIERTAQGIRFHVTHAGLMLDLYDAVRSYRCTGSVGRTAQYLERHHAVFAILAAPRAGDTMTLGDLSRLR